jgi:CSLREA domain-containing protein
MGWWLRSLLVFVAALVAAPVAYGAEIPVTTTADEIANNGVCSLREAVFAARFNSGVPPLGCPPGSATDADTILLGAGTYELAPAPGAVTEDGNESGDLDTGPGPAVLRVVGRGAGATVIDPLLGDRAFDVFANVSLTLDSLTIRRGRAAPSAPGGAVRNQGALIVLRSAFVGNSAGSGPPGTPGAATDPGGAGGAIWSGNQSTASVLVADSLFSGNRAGTGGDGSGSAMGFNGGGGGGDGGAIAITSGSGDVSGSTFAGNRAGDGGRGGPFSGEIWVGGDGGSGGALAASGGAVVTVQSSTFSGNAAGAGGEGRPFDDSVGVSGDGGAADLASVGGGSLRMSWSTFAGNVRGGPDAIGGNGVDGGQVGASILADPAPACGGLLPPVLANLTLPGDPSCPGPRLAGDPRLGPLAANGGLTPTLLPGPGSAAIDALAGLPCPGTDQRGLPRPRLGGCDAGAVEVQPGEAVAAARGGTGGAAPARRVSGLRLRPAAFRAAGAGGSVGAGATSLLARAPIGTTVSYRLDGTARVTFTITRKVAGRRKGKRCVKPAAAAAGAPRCRRTQRLKGSFVHQGRPGLNSFRFTGRLRPQALPPGLYTLVAKLPKPASGRGATTSRGFRIVR